MHLSFFPLAIAASLLAQPLVDSDVLEPSLQNEVDYALSKAPHTQLPPHRAIDESTNRTILTNSLSRTALAIKLVSEQRADGRWFVGTNDVTAAAVEILRSL